MKCLNLKYTQALRFASAGLAALALSACTLEPDYERPETPIDAKVEALKEFKYAEGLWKEASPLDTLPKGKWWEFFNDEELNRLVAACREKNPTLKAAFQTVEQARHKARMTESELYPWVNGNASWAKTGTSKNEISYRGTFEDYRIGLGLTWDLDLFGRVQALIKSDVALAQAQYAAYEGVMLMLETEIASAYFSICQYNSEIKLLKDTINVRKEQLERTQKGVQVEYNTDLDLSRAEQLYFEALSQIATVKNNRDIAANYLAYLIGSIPSAQKISDKLLDGTIPETPAVLPSTLLERRSDIAEIERKLFAANYRIGSATSAFFPTIQITSSLDMASSSIDNLLDSSSLAWGVSPRIYIPLFQAGKLWAQRQIAIAEHAQIAETYKDKVLFAIYETESALASITNLKVEYESRLRVSEASNKVTELTKKKLDAGSVDYFEYSDAERLSLANERETIRLRGERFRAIVSLVKAIGGSPTDDARKAEGQEVSQVDSSAEVKGS